MENKNIRKVTVVERNGEVISRTVENNGNDINSNFENNIESNIAIQNPKHIFIILGAVMLLIGIAIGIYGVFNAKSVSLKEETYIPIEAKVVDYEERIERTEDEDGYVTTEHTYRDIFEYTVDNTTYTKTSSMGRSYHSDIGSIKQIKYNPNNPSQILENGTSDIVIPFVFAGFLGICGILVLFVGIKK